MQKWDRNSSHGVEMETTGNREKLDSAAVGAEPCQAAPHAAASPHTNCSGFICYLPFETKYAVVQTLNKEQTC